MSTIDRLTQAHRSLASQVMILDSALDMGPEAWFVIRETCFSLSAQLQEHIKHEQRLVGRRLNRLHRIGAEEWRRAAIDHSDVAQRLRAVNGILAGDPCFSISGLRPTLATVVQTLRRQITEQETALFPWLSFASMVQTVFGRDAASVTVLPLRRRHSPDGSGPQPVPPVPRNLLDTARRRW